MSFDKEAKILNHLIDINRDACDFYKSAAEKADDTQLAQTFTNLERLHSSVENDLRRFIVENGGKANADGSIVGASARIFGELVAKISNDTDATLVAHLEEAEDRCLHSLEDAMKKDIRPDVKTVLLNELSTLRKTHDYMKTLKDKMKAA